MPELNISDAPIEYRRYLTIGDARGNFNQKVDSVAEAEMAIQEYCSYNLESDCRTFFKYLTDHGFQLPPLVKCIAPTLPVLFERLWRGEAEDALDMLSKIVRSSKDSDLNGRIISEILKVVKQYFKAAIRHDGDSDTKRDFIYHAYRLLARLEFDGFNGDQELAKKVATELLTILKDNSEPFEEPELCQRTYKCSPFDDTLYLLGIIATSKKFDKSTQSFIKSEISSFTPTTWSNSWCAPTLTKLRYLGGGKSRYSLKFSAQLTLHVGGSFKIIIWTDRPENHGISWSQKEYKKIKNGIAKTTIYLDSRDFASRADVNLPYGRQGNAGQPTLIINPKFNYKHHPWYQ